MIAAKGQAVTITRRAAGAYNAATASATITTTTQLGKGVILPFASGLRHAPGSNIPMTDRQSLLSGLNSAGVALTAPRVDDTLTDASGQVYAITEVNQLAPAGLAILFELTVRIAGPATTVTATTYRIQLETGSGSILLEDGVGYLLLESAP